MTKKRVLMIAFHFPPFAGSSGVQRTLRFVQYLPKHGWNPQVLTAHQRVHENLSESLGTEISGIKVKRAFALDTAKHLSMKGRYPNWLAVPDRWISWLFGAIPSGLFLIRKNRPDIIWSTYPIATSHYIGYFLHRLTSIPWVADFRDPMVEKNVRTNKYTPANNSIRNARLWIERKVVEHADRLVFCTEGARSICKERYPEADHEKWMVIPNGYDERTFAVVEQSLEKFSADSSAESKVTLLHSGFLYYSTDRDPSCFFMAISKLKQKQLVDTDTLNIILRASGFEKEYGAILDDLDIADIVRLEPSVSYSDALKEMLTVDGLLIFQGYTSNPAIPAKAYEYLRAKKPVLSLVDDAGDTAALMRDLHCDFIAPLDDAEKIETMLLRFVEGIKNKNIAIADPTSVSGYSRERLTGKLADVFDSIPGK